MDAVRHLARRLQRALFAGRRGAHLRADAAAEATTVSWKPGDRKPVTEAMIRVDQAGEYGATRIYAGQLAVMGDRTPVARSIAGMAAQEDRHQAFFDAMIARRSEEHTSERQSLMRISYAVYCLQKTTAQT